jgi:hypothetical protein
VAKVVECLPRKRKALSSKSGTVRKRKGFTGNVRQGFPRFACFSPLVRPEVGEFVSLGLSFLICKMQPIHMAGAHHSQLPLSPSINNT